MVLKGNILKTKQVISMREMKKLVGSFSTVPKRGWSLGLVLTVPGTFQAKSRLFYPPILSSNDDMPSDISVKLSVL